MRYRLGVLALLTLGACATKEARRPDTASLAAATLAGSAATDAAALRKGIDSMGTRLTNAMLRGDTAAAVSGYTDDAIVMPPNEKTAHGHAEIAKSFAGMLAKAKVIAFTAHTEDVIATGDYGIETGTYDMTLQPKTGKPVHDVGKYLAVWKKQPDGGYKMVRDIFNSDLPAK